MRLVFDGDTVRVRTSGCDVCIRLDSIDCPEGDQPWGDIATAGLIKQIGGRDVLLETHGMDCHGRTLATLYVMSDGELINVNEGMVMLGHAWETTHLYRHLSPARQRSLRRLQRWAMLKRVGLWKMRGAGERWREGLAGAVRESD